MSSHMIRQVEVSVRLPEPAIQLSVELGMLTAPAHTEEE